MCVKRSDLAVYVAVAKASLAGGDRQPSAQHAINSRVLLYKVTTAITIVTVTIYRAPKSLLTAPVGKLRRFRKSLFNNFFLLIMLQL